jgi:hypothetical protein
MKTQTNWFAYFRAVEAARAKREAKFGRLPLWFYPCAVIAFAIPFMTLALIIFT